jgi:hypothetical protein
MWHGSLETGGSLLNNEEKFERSVATQLNRVVVAGKIIKNRIICSYRKIILNKLQKETD